mmetsp:Transcript_30385/g.79705  ORF Transcript_30385/g.79705 Transcript_30385/m.79705 type:complete len:236 (-) Transcript_30385:117-824(-)
MKVEDEALRVPLRKQIHKRVAKPDFGLEVHGQVHQIVNPLIPPGVHRLHQVVAQEAARQVAHHDRGLRPTLGYRVWPAAVQHLLHAVRDAAARDLRDGRRPRDRRNERQGPAAERGAPAARRARTACWLRGRVGLAVREVRQLPLHQAAPAHAVVVVRVVDVGPVDVGPRARGVCRAARVFVQGRARARAYGWARARVAHLLSGGSTFTSRETCNLDLRRELKSAWELSASASHR